MGSENNLFSIGLFQENTLSPETRRALAVLESRSFFNQLYKDDTFISILMCNSDVKASELVVSKRCFRVSDGVWINKPEKLSLLHNFGRIFLMKLIFQPGI